MLESHGNMSILLSDVHKLLLGDIPLNFTDIIQNERRHANFFGTQKNREQIYILLKYL